MGRWAQARRRGGKPVAGGGPSPPPAPFLQWEVGDLIVTATGGDDTGGLLRLYQADLIEGPYYPFDARAWAGSERWDAGSFEPRFWYVATEEGNGVNYAGESPQSGPVYAP